jgi:HEAT repeat protein
VRPLRTPRTIKDFVHQTFIHGVPYEQASEYGPEVVPTLLAMLESPREETYWSNIAVTLGVIGDERALAPLIKFVEQGGPGPLSSSQYAAKTSALMSLGYLINKSKNEVAINYLVGGLQSSSWKDRGITWRSPFHESTAAQDQQMVSTSIMGLALSGHPAARAALVTFQRESGEKPEFTALLDEAIRANDEINRVGLRGYYEKNRRN